MARQQKLKVAAVQASAPLFDSAVAIARVAHFAAQAAKEGAALAVFPEAFVGGYPKGSHFGAPVGSRTEEGRDLYRQYFDAAISVPGAETEALSKIAKDNKIDFVIGVIEREGENDFGGTIYCTALCFSAGGELLGKRRKLMPTAAERVIWGFGDGSTIETFEATSARLSAVICWENYMPALRMSQYAQGVEIYCAPTVDDRENWTPLMRTIAREGRCFVISANQFMRRSDAPSDFPFLEAGKPDDVLINGGSTIVSPLGDVLAGPVFGEETILYADIDLSEIARGKMDFDVTGHYARADVFELSVNRAPQKPVK